MDADGATKEIQQGANYEPSNPGICSKFADNNILESGSEQRLRFALWMINFFLMLSSLTFFGLDEPHDCFVCFGKDPDRVYSRF